MDAPHWCTRNGQDYRLAVQLQPGAKKNEVVGVHGDALKIRLQAQPIEGRANAAITSYIAGLLGLPRSAVAITHGDTARSKLLRIAAPSLTLEEVRAALLPPSSAQ